jgi:hypothetical protein
MSALHRLARRIDPGYLVVLLIAVIAVWPLISRASLPEGTDAELHIFRLYELSQLIRGGELYPRWAPDFYHGYGYPIFNYYAPLTYYLGLPLELLPGVDAVLAVKALFAAGIVLAGIGCYGFVRDNWGRPAGFVAAAMMMYAPYVQYIDPHIRGALPESFSFAVFPLALWALDRLRQRPGWGAWAASVLLVAAVILTHNLMALLFYGLLVAWVVWQIGLSWAGRPAGARWPAGWRDRLFGDGGRLVVALLLGVGVAAFFWLPVVLERNAVNLTTLIGAGDNYDFRTHFLSWRELLAFSQRPDWGATQSPFVFNLGVAQWLGGALGVVMLALGRVHGRGHLLYFVLALLVLLVLMLPVSAPLWEALPFMAYFQFPWRLLGGAAVMLAVLGGAGFGALADGLLARTWRSWLPAVGVALPMLLALPLSQPTPWQPFGEVNLLRMSLIENSGRWLGTTSTADYVPVTVEMLPGRKGSVVENFSRGLPPDRVNREAMPDGTVVETEVLRPLWTRYHVTAPKQFRLRLFQFDFPGWQVTIDGQPATTELAKPEGFIVVLVPEGQHVVDVRFGGTLARSLAWAISAVSLLLAAAYGWALNRRRAAQVVENDGAAPWRSQSVWPATATAGVITAVFLLLQPLGLFHYESTDLTLDRPATATEVNFGDQIALLGFDMLTEQLDPGDTLALSLFWKALRPLTIDYQSFVHIFDASGNLVAQADRLNPGEFPTRRWPLDKYVPDLYTIPLPDNLPPGQYSVATGLWVQSEGWRLPVFSAEGEPIADNAPLFTFEVR